MSNIAAAIDALTRAYHELDRALEHMPDYASSIAKLKLELAQVRAAVRQIDRRADNVPPRDA